MSCNSDSEEDIPLTNFLSTVNLNNMVKENSVNDDFISDDIDESYFPTCDIQCCDKDINSLCDICNCMLCKDHALSPCSDGHKQLLLLEPARPENVLVVEQDRPTEDLPLLQVGLLTSIDNISYNFNKGFANNSPKPINPRNDIQLRNTCEIGICKGELFAACPLCYRYLCYNHLDNSECANDHKILKRKCANENEDNVNTTISLNITTSKSSKKVRSLNSSICSLPESFEVDGSRKEGSSINTSKKSNNKKKTAKELRNKGEAYTSFKKNIIVPARNKLKPRCNGDVCKKFAHECIQISEGEREKVIEDYYATGSLQLQREYIARYVKKKLTNKKTSNKEDSRRKYTLAYFLPKGEGEVSVCKKLFLNTLGISDRTIRTTLSKIKESGVIQKEQRGGRSTGLQNQDKVVRESIKDHINRFARVESHYCRASTSKEYLHPDLSLYKMVEMFNSDSKYKGTTTSYYTYSDEFKKMNLAFHHPKKDQCTLCNVYRCGDVTKKAELEQRYQLHIAEKKCVRDFKTYVKEHLADETCVGATFDLQQVILLPIAAESQLFYNRRLTNFNMTIYDIASKDCACFVWHEGQGRRGSGEIATCLYKFLSDLDSKKVTEVFLFSDGCCGQNKNSGIATMLLHVVNTSKHIKRISLKFFEPYHGQNEGDSAHSAITSALHTAGNVYVPAELKTIIRLARRNKPYSVHSMENNDFLDFLGLAQKLKVLSVRSDDEGEKLNWPTMVEYMTLKKEPNKIFFKSSHLTQVYRSLTIPISKSEVYASMKPRRLYKGNQPMLTKEKYNDLTGLCAGATPIIRGDENVSFYKNLRHK